MAIWLSQRWLHLEALLSSDGVVEEARICWAPSGANLELETQIATASASYR